MPVDSNLLKGYETAVGIAVEKLRTANPEELAKRCGAEYDAESRQIKLEYLKKTYVINWPDGEINGVPITTKVLLLNYVLGARAQQATGELIAYRDIPGAATYEPSFQKRAVSPLARTFDNKPEMLYAAAERLGGEKVRIADAAVKIRVLPLMEVIYGVSNSDEEFGTPQGVILFDSSVKRLMTAECIIVAASNGVYELLKIAREMHTSS